MSWEAYGSNPIHDKPYCIHCDGTGQVPDDGTNCGECEQCSGTGCSDEWDNWDDVQDYQPPTCLHCDGIGYFTDELTNEIKKVCVICKGTGIEPFRKKPHG